MDDSFKEIVWHFYEFPKNDVLPVNTNVELTDCSPAVAAFTLRQFTLWNYAGRPFLTLRFPNFKGIKHDRSKWKIFKPFTRQMLRLFLRFLNPTSYESYVAFQREAFLIISQDCLNLKISGLFHAFIPLLQMNQTYKSQPLNVKYF